MACIRPGEILAASLTHLLNRVEPRLQHAQIACSGRSLEICSTSCRRRLPCLSHFGPYIIEGDRPLSFQSQQLTGVLLVDLFLIINRCRHVVDYTNRFSDEAGTFLWIEWHIRPEKHVIGAEEC